MSTNQPKGGDALWLGVKAGIVHVWVAGKTVWSPCYTWAISECFRDKGLIIKRYINSSVYSSVLYFLPPTRFTKIVQPFNCMVRYGCGSSFWSTHKNNEQSYLVSCAKQPWNKTLYFIWASSSCESHFSVQQTSHVYGSTTTTNNYLHYYRLRLSL